MEHLTRGTLSYDTTSICIVVVHCHSSSLRSACISQSLGIGNSCCRVGPACNDRKRASVCALYRTIYRGLSRYVNCLLVWVGPFLCCSYYCQIVKAQSRGRASSHRAVIGPNARPTPPSDWHSRAVRWWCCQTNKRTLICGFALMAVVLFIV